MTRLVGLLQRYGKAIEYDLLTICNGVRLSTEWQARNFRLLLSLIDQLPMHSRYSEAVSEDEELALLMQGEARPETVPSARLSTWSPEVRELRTVAERLGIVGQLLAVLSSQTYRPEPLPRPVTAEERLREQAETDAFVAAHRKARAALLPDQYT